MPVKATVAVVGAGITGLTTARILRDAGHRVEVFERDRQLGGRMRGEREDALRFETGAQYVTARTREFKRFLDTMVMSGHAAQWAPRLSIAGTDLTGDILPRDWYVGSPTMGSMLRPLAEDLRISLNARVKALHRDNGSWFVEVLDQTQRAGPFHTVLVTGTAPDSFPLLADHSEDFDQMTQVRMLPVWSVLVHLDQPLPVDFDVGSRLSDAIAWIARDSSKPNRKRDQENWIIHAGPDFSREFFEEEPEDVALELWREAKTLLGVLDIEPALTKANLWRHALVERTLGASCLFSRDAMLGAAGDWCLGTRAESAHESAIALARRVNDTFQMM